LAVHHFGLNAAGFLSLFLGVGHFDEGERNGKVVYGF